MDIYSRVLVQLPPNPKTNPKPNPKTGAIVWLLPNPKSNLDLDPYSNPNRGAIFLRGYLTLNLNNKQVRSELTP